MGVEDIWEGVAVEIGLEGREGWVVLEEIEMIELKLGNSNFCRPFFTRFFTWIQEIILEYI